MVHSILITINSQEDGQSLLHSPILTYSELMNVGAWEGLQYLSLKNAEIIESYGDLGNPQEFPEALKKALKVRVLHIMHSIYIFINIHNVHIK